MARLCPCTAIFWVGCGVFAAWSVPLPEIPGIGFDFSSHSHAELVLGAPRKQQHTDTHKHTNSHTHPHRVEGGVNIKANVCLKACAYVIVSTVRGFNPELSNMPQKGWNHSQLQFPASVAPMLLVKIKFHASGGRMPSRSGPRRGRFRTNRTSNIEHRSQTS